VLDKKVTDVAPLIDREAPHTNILLALFTLRQVLRSKVFIEIGTTTSTATLYSNRQRDIFQRRETVLILNKWFSIRFPKYPRMMQGQCLLKNLIDARNEIS